MHPDILSAFGGEMEKIAGDESRWGELIVDAPGAKLTKKDVFDYYSEPRIRNAILAQVKDREVIVRQSFTPAQVILKRKEKGNFIRINRAGDDVNDPSDLSYFTERRMTEIHPVFRKNEDKLIVDLDPRPEFPFEDTKSYAAEISSFMKKVPGVGSSEVRYSGGRGFYVVGHLKSPVHVDKGRELLKTHLAPLLDADERLTMGVPQSDGQMRLDLSTFKERGSLRGLYSLNATTGLVSVPVKDVATFDPRKDATIEAVLGRKPKAARHAR